MTNNSRDHPVNQRKLHNLTTTSTTTATMTNNNKNNSSSATTTKKSRRQRHTQQSSSSSCSSQQQQSKKPSPPPPTSRLSFLTEQDSNNHHNYNLNTTPSSSHDRKQYARHLYEVSGDAVSSLRTYRTTTTTTPVTTRTTTSTDDDDTNTTTNPDTNHHHGLSLEQHHNLSLLSYLASIHANNTVVVGGGGGGTMEEEDNDEKNEKDAKDQTTAAVYPFTRLLETAVVLPKTTTTTTTTNRSEEDGCPTSSSSSSKPNPNNPNNPNISSHNGTVLSPTTTTSSSLAPLVLAHNLALGYLVRNDPGGGVGILLPFFQAFSSSSPKTKKKDHHPSTSSCSESSSHNNNETERRNNRDDERGDIECKIAFLLLDCVLAMRRIDCTEDILRWIEGYIEQQLSLAATTTTAAAASSSGTGTTGVVVSGSGSAASGSTTTQSLSSPSVVPASTTTTTPTTTTSNSTATTTATPYVASTTELKFRLNCYRSRILFLRNKFEPSVTKRDANTRLARKELKSAMEIYHHKLAVGGSNNNHAASLASKRGGGGGSGGNNTNSNNNTDGGGSVQSTGSNVSVTEGTTVSDGDGGNGRPSSPSYVTPTTTTTTTANAYQTKKRDVQSQCALYMKANLEFLKGHTKKSLKLCSEAKNAGERQNRSSISSSSTTTTTTNIPHTSECASIPSDETGTELPDSSPTVRNRLTDVHRALHYNNVAIAHQSKNKIHVALYYYARSLWYVEQIEQRRRRRNIDESTSTTTNSDDHDNSRNSNNNNDDDDDDDGFEADGTARPLPTAEILYNAALCAQQAEKYDMAYECMARCVGVSPKGFGKDPRCWLRLAEGCIGIHSTLRREGRSIGGRINKPDTRKRTRTIQSRISNIPPSLVIESSTSTKRHPTSSGSPSNLPPNITLGSEDDLNSVRHDPLPRALDCLNRCLRLCNKTHGTLDISLPSSMTETDKSCRESARVALAYVWMELDNPTAVLRLADLVLNDDDLHSQPRVDGGMDNRNTETNARGRLESAVSRRRKATVRLYACEAACALGYPTRALEYLIVHGQEKLRPDGNSQVKGVGEEGVGVGDSGETGIGTDDSSWYLNDAERLVSALAMLDDTGDRSSVFSEVDTRVKASCKPWELCRIDDAKASVKLALAGTCLLTGRVDTAKRLTHSLPSGSSGGGHDIYRSNHYSFSRESTDIAIQNSVLYYLIRDGKLKEALNLLRVSRMS